MIEIRPQAGPQENFLSSSADIVIFGGAAFGGKSFGLLMEAIRHKDDPRYNGVIFRRESPMITSGGGLWDTAGQIYPHVGGEPKEHKLTYVFPEKSYIKFTHLQHEGDKLNHQGAQYVFIGFDELTHFTEGQFWYLLTRNRPPSGCTLRPYCRCTTNPDADSWVRDLIIWWIDEETGYAIPERSGIVRYFTRIDDELIWVEKDWQDENGNGPKSLTFIPSYIDDNPAGMEADPTYKSNLMAQDSVTRERLLEGNWNITYKGGMFDPFWFKIVDKAPSGIKWIRYWDRAATIPKDEEDDPDWNAGAKIGMLNGELYIADMNRFRDTSLKIEEEIKRTATADGYNTSIGYEVEPGSSGIEVANYYQTKVLKGFEVHLDRPTGKKEERCRPWCALAEHGHVYLVKGPWNRVFLAEAGSFPFAKKDQVDAVSGGYKIMTRSNLVWPFFDSSHVSNFKIDWDKVDPDQAFVYVVLVGQKDGTVYVAFFFWGRKTKILRVYDELIYANPIAEEVGYDIRTTAKVPIIQQNNEVAIRKIIGNDDMFTGGKDIVWQLRRKAKIRVKKVLTYSQAGAILQANNMMSTKHIRIHTRASETIRQVRNWTVEKKERELSNIPRPEAKGFPLCVAICHMISALREEGEMMKKVELKPYTRQKKRIRDTLYRGKQPYIPTKKKKNEYTYLTK